MKLRAFSIIVIAALAASIARADAPAVASAQTVTLTLRTSDGLALIDGEPDFIKSIPSALEVEPFPPRTNRTLYAWLSAHGANAEDIRLFACGDVAPISGTSAMRWRKTTVSKASLAGELPYIAGRPLQDVYMAIRAAGAKMYLIAPDGSPETAADFTRTLFIMSSAYGDGMSGIYVDGVDMAPVEGKGYNIVTFAAESGEVTGVGGFDMFTGPEESERMEEFLRSQPKGSYVAAAIKHGSGPFLSPGAMGALQEFGSRRSLNPEMLISHAMFGGKVEGVSAVEASEINLGSKIVLFGGGARVSEADIASGIVPGPGRAVALSGSRPDDVVFILEQTR